MAFRDDLEAARERVVSLERDLAAAREQREQDQIRLNELEERLAFRSRLPEPLQTPFWGSARQLSLFTMVVGGGAALLALLIALALFQPARPKRPERPETRYWRLPLEQALKGTVPDNALLFELEADQIDRQGRVSLDRYRQLRARAQGTACERFTWSHGLEVKIERSESPCAQAPLLPIRCSPVELWHKLPKDLYWARFEYQDGKWQISQYDLSFEVADDCEGQFWPPHG